MLMQVCQLLPLRLRWWSNPPLRCRRGLMLWSFYSRCFTCPEGRPRLPHRRYRGEQRKTRRHHFRLTVSRRDALRMFRTRAVCLMLRQDSSFGQHEGASRLRRILLPTTLDDFDVSVCEHFPVYAWPSDSACLLNPTVLQTVLTSGISSLPAAGTSAAAPPLDLGAGRLLESVLPGCPYQFSPQ